MGVIQQIGIVLQALFANRASLAMENLALRQQLAVLKKSAKCPRLRQRDRIFWVWLRRLWKGWRCCLVVVQPDSQQLRMPDRDSGHRRS